MEIFLKEWNADTLKNKFEVISPQRIERENPGPDLD